MPYPMDWDPTPVKTKKLPPLKVPAPLGVLPYRGARNPMTRNNAAHRVSLAMSTPATKGQPQIYHFESEGEFAVALEASLDPDFHGLEVQLPPIRYPWRYNKRGYRDHYFDLRITMNDGYRIAAYVKNGKGLRTERVQEEIDAIFSCVDDRFADETIVVNTDNYSRARRDNLRRMWYLHGLKNPSDDEAVSEIAHRVSFWLMSDLIDQCPLPRVNAWRSCMRLIAQGVLEADWDAVINRHSRAWLAE